MTEFPTSLVLMVDSDRTIKKELALSLKVV